MAKYFFIVIVYIGIMQSCSSSKEKYSNTELHSTAPYNKKTKNIPMKTTELDLKQKAVSLTCKLTTPELQKRKKTVISQLQSKVLEKKELDEGFAYRFDGSDSMIDLVTDFIKTERQCCDFFTFELSVPKDNYIWLTITGPAGAKDFIKVELEL